MRRGSPIEAVAGPPGPVTGVRARLIDWLETKVKSARVSAMGLSALLFVAAGASAQVPSPTGNIYGTARDTQGSSLAGAAVTLTGPGAAQRAATDATGDFHFLGLSPGDYSVVLELTGFETVRADVTVALANVVLSFVMPVAGVEEAVEVTGDSARLDNREIETGATFGRKELEDIPTTRDPWAVLRQVPGVLVEQHERGKRQPAVSPASPGRAPPRNRPATTSMASRSVWEAYRRSSSTSMRSATSR